jgi:hypothetical protein
VDLLDLLFAQGAVPPPRGVDGTTSLGRPWLGFALRHFMSLRQLFFCPGALTQACE